MESIKVYAQFVEEEEGVQFRTKTLLQFGDSWDLIGSIVMKNPGSALPIGNLNDDILKNISTFYDDNIECEQWFEFKADSTMHRIKPIFSGKYVGNEKALNGIIQVFNLFNIREKDIQRAKKLAGECKSKHLYPNTAETIKLFSSKPVYLGFNWEYVKKDNEISSYKVNINRFANEIFDAVKNSDQMYMEKDIVDNFLYHPLSTQITSEKYQPTLKKFNSLYEEN